MAKALTKRRPPPRRPTTTLAVRNASLRTTAAQAGRAAASAGRAVARTARSVARRAGTRIVTVNQPAPAWQETLAIAGGAAGAAALSALLRYKAGVPAEYLAYGMTAGGLGGALVLPGMYRLACGGMGAVGAAQVIYIEAQKLAGEKVRKELEQLGMNLERAKAPPSPPAAKPGDRPQAALPQSFDRGVFFEPHLVDDAARFTDESMYAQSTAYAPAYAAAPM
jgi:hypothetical protein